MKYKIRPNLAILALAMHCPNAEVITSPEVTPPTLFLKPQETREDFILSLREEAAKFDLYQLPEEITRPFYASFVRKNKRDIYRRINL